MLAIRTPGFQTFLVNRATAYLESELNTRVKIDRIEIEFFRTLSIKGLYIEDLHHDTLLYAGEISSVIEMFAPAENKIFLWLAGQFSSSRSVQWVKLAARCVGQPDHYGVV